MKSFGKTLFKFVSKIFLLVLIVSFAFTSGYYIGLKGFVASTEKFPLVKISRDVPVDKTLDFSLFWKVWDTLNEKYFDKTKLVPAKMVYGAIKGMVAALEDPYTVFLPPNENKIVQEDLLGSFDGAGIQIGFIGVQLAVIAPLPNSPAEKAGVKAGDFIVGIKDEAKNIDRGTSGISLPEAVQLIRGKRGTKVTLTLIREGVKEPFEVDIIRENINVPSLIVDYPLQGGEDKSIAHLNLLKFSGETEGEWEEVVIELLKNSQLEGIILDVRNNPGGYLYAAVELASDFLNQGSLVVSEEDGNGNKKEYRVERIPRLRDYKVVVLINKGSASASEIFAGALRDQKKVKLIGETSFGKGTIQKPQQIDGGAGLHITISRWLTPSGFWVNQGGLKPDVEIEDNPDTKEDEQLLKAIEVLKSFSKTSDNVLYY